MGLIRTILSVLFFLFILWHFKLQPMDPGHRKIDVAVFLEPGSDDAGQPSLEILMATGIHMPGGGLHQLARAIDNKVPIVATTSYLYALKIKVQSMQKAIKTLNEEKKAVEAGYWLVGGKMVKISDLKDEQLKTFSEYKNKLLITEKMLQNRKAEGYHLAWLALKDPQQWSVYQNKAGDMMVLIPHGYYSSDDGYKLGFNKELIKLSAPKIEKVVNESAIGYKIDVAHLINVFSLEPGDRLRVYLTGHGTSVLQKGVPLIARLTQKEYVTLLNFLNPYCDFFFVFSCFSGGANLTEMLQESIDLNNVIFKKEDIRFPIGVGATADNVAFYTPDLNFKEFFSHLDAYLQGTGKKRDEHLKKALTTIYAKKLQNIPSIRMPGINSYFRPIQLDAEIKIFTYVFTKARQIENQPMNLSNLKGVLFYPSVIPLEFTLRSKTVPQVISMIGGTAHHFIKSITASSIDIRTLFSAFKSTTPASKAYFISSVRVGNYQNSGILHPNAPENDKPEEVLVLKKVIFYQQKLKTTIFFEIEDKGIYRHCIVDFSTQTQHLTCRTVNPAQAKQFEQHVVANTTPIATRLKEATAGNETEQEFLAALHEYFMMQ